MTTAISVSHDTWLEVMNLSDGTFAPLSGFMDAKSYHSTVNNMRLPDQSWFPIPITLDIPQDLEKSLEKDVCLVLKNVDGEDIAQVKIEDIFEIAPLEDVQKVFGTSDRAHPGVAQELARSPLRVGGKVELIKSMDAFFPEYAFSPEQTRTMFKEKGWKTTASFQTRNPGHRAHEYLQRVAMELCDGIFIQPLIGWKKADDFSPKAVIAGYEKLFSDFYPAERALLGTLRTPMRYAGPREALFHAIIRRNHGCTHFIVGRDHAGVGDFYGKYEAQDLCKQIDNLGIEILALCGPYYCKKCGMIVTEKTCGHGEKYVENISGTKMREMLHNGICPPESYMRKEIAEVLIELAKTNELFVGN